MHPRPHKKTLTDGQRAAKIAPIFAAIPSPIPENLPFGYWRQWIDTKEGKFYLRLTRHMVDRVLYKSLDIASIEFGDGWRGRGLGTEFLIFAERFAATNGLEIIYVESISSEVLKHIVQKHGYKENPSLPTTWYKIVAADEVV